MAEKFVAVTIEKHGIKYEMEVESFFGMDDLIECGIGSQVRLNFRRWAYKAEKPEYIGNSYFTPMPGNHGIIVSHDLVISPQFRGQGLSRIFQELRTKFAKKVGADAIIASVNLGNLPQVFSAKSAGWKFAHTFDNKRTGNNLALIINTLN